MTENNLQCLDISSKKDSHRRIAIFPEFLSDTNISILEEHLGELVQYVSQDHAYQIFLQASREDKTSEMKNKSSSTKNIKDDIDSPQFSPLTNVGGVGEEKSPAFSPIKTVLSNWDDMDGYEESPKFSPIKNDDKMVETKHSKDVINKSVDDEALLLDLSDEDSETIGENLGNHKIDILEKELKQSLRTEEILKLHFRIAEAVKKNLNKYYKQKTNNSKKFVIKDKVEFSTLAKEFSDEFRHSIKKRYFHDKNTLKGITFTELDSTCIRNKIEYHFKKMSPH